MGETYREALGLCTSVGLSFSTISTRAAPTLGGASEDPGVSISLV